MSYNILSNMIFNIDGYYFGKAYNSDDFSNKLGEIMIKLQLIQI